MKNNKSPMIFIVGNSRSGTTMMANILENHPDVFKFHELHFFEELWTPEDNEKRLDHAEAVHMAARLLSAQRYDYIIKDIDPYLEEAEQIIWKLDTDSITAIDIYKAFIAYEVLTENCIFACENTPTYVFYIGEILQLFPDARIVNMVRDTRDVLLSQKKKWKRAYNRVGGWPRKETLRSIVNYHPVTTSKLWNSAVEAADRFHEHDNVVTVRYEDLLGDPEGTVSGLCDFIGIGYDQSLLEIPHTGSSHVKDSKKKGIRKHKGPKWQGGGLNSAEIYICQKITRTFLEKYGYQIIPANPNLFLLIYYFISFPVKLLFAFLMNLGRMRNIADTIKRRLLR